MKLLSKFRKAAAFQEFSNLEASINALGKPRSVYIEYQDKLKADVDTSERAYLDNPSLLNVAKLNEAVARRKALSDSDYRMKIENLIVGRQSTLKNSSEARRVYRGCLEAIQAVLKDEIADARGKLMAMYEDLEDASNPDEQPALLKLRFQLEFIEGTLEGLDREGPLDDHFMGQLYAIIRGSLPGLPVPSIHAGALA